MASRGKETICQSGWRDTDVGMALVLDKGYRRMDRDCTTRKGQILTIQGNLTNFHSQKYSGLTNAKVSTIRGELVD